MIEFEAIRAQVDFVFTDMAKELSDAYYLHWKNNESLPWEGFDLYPGDAVKTKLLFDFLHGFIFINHDLTISEIATTEATYAEGSKDKLKLDAKSIEAKLWSDNADITLIDLGLNPIDWSIIEKRIKKDLKDKAGKTVVLKAAKIK